jgi:hypothetical protein
MRMNLNITKENDDAMVSHLKFKVDLIAGLIGEGLAKQYVENLGYIYVGGPEDNVLKEFDLLCSYGDKIRKFECKIDVLCKPPTEYYSSITKRTHTLESDTGNIFIEFTSRGKQSGIITTTSDVWLYNFYYLREIWTIPTPKLRTLINENNFPIGVGGDPGSDSSGYLIPRHQYSEHFNRTEYQLNII